MRRSGLAQACWLPSRRAGAPRSRGTRRGERARRRAASCPPRAATAPPSPPGLCVGGGVQRQGRAARWRRGPARRGLAVAASGHRRRHREACPVILPLPAPRALLGAHWRSHQSCSAARARMRAPRQQCARLPPPSCAFARPFAPAKSLIIHAKLTDLLPFCHGCGAVRSSSGEVRSNGADVRGAFLQAPLLL